jgi:hypothetical protein
MRTSISIPASAGTTLDRVRLATTPTLNGRSASDIRHPLQLQNLTRNFFDRIPHLLRIDSGVAARPIAFDDESADAFARCLQGTSRQEGSSTHTARHWLAGIRSCAREELLPISSSLVSRNRHRLFFDACTAIHIKRIPAFISNNAGPGCAVVLDLEWRFRSSPAGQTVSVWPNRRTGLLVPEPNFATR